MGWCSSRTMSRAPVWAWRCFFFWPEVADGQLALEIMGTLCTSTHKAPFEWICRSNQGTNGSSNMAAEYAMALAMGVAATAVVVADVAMKWTTSSLGMVVAEESAALMSKQQS